MKKKPSPKTRRLRAASARRTIDRRRAEGVCVQCAHPELESLTMCARCHEMHRDRARAAYRRRHGLPLDAPTTGPGSPRSLRWQDSDAYRVRHGIPGAADPITKTKKKNRQQPTKKNK